jgi:hypothetical protein
MNFNWTAIVIILVLIGVIVLQRSCGSKCPTIPPAKTDTVYLHVRDTILQDHPIPYAVIKEGKPYPVSVKDTEFITVMQNVDTAAILRDYFVTRFYIDTSKTKYGTLFIRDSVTQNRIKFRQIIADWNIPEVHTVQPAPLRNQVFVGLDIGSNGKTLGFGPSLLLRTKTEAMYGLGASYVPGLSPGLFFHLSSYWKIHL